MLAPQTLLCEGFWKGYTFKKHLAANIIFGLLQGAVVIVTLAELTCHLFSFKDSINRLQFGS